LHKDKLKYYLQLLKIEEDADISQIKYAYRNAAKINHPDKSDNKNAAVLFAEVKEAHDTLITLRLQNEKGSLLKNFNEIKITEDRSKFQKEKVTYRDIIDSRKFWTLSLTAINVLILIKIGFNTVITPLYLFLILSSFSAISCAFYKTWKKLQIRFIGHFTIPLFLLNLLLGINFSFTDKPTIERHFFKSKITTSGYKIGIKQNESTLIILENDAYRDYPGIRLYFDLDPLLFSNAVELQFETGILGFRLLKKSTPISVKKQR
jgi:hypothetical protein